MKLVNDWIRHREAHIGIEAPTSGVILVGCHCPSCTEERERIRRIEQNIVVHSNGTHEQMLRPGV